MVAFHPVSEKQKHPPAKEKSRAPNPPHEKEKDDPREDHGDADGMQQLVRSGFVLVIVLCHVVRQARHVAHLPAALCGRPSRSAGTSTFNVDFIPNLVNFLECPGTTESINSSGLSRYRCRLCALCSFFLQVPATLHRFQHRDFIRVFQVRTHGDAHADARHAHAQRLQ